MPEELNCDETLSWSVRLSDRQPGKLVGIALIAVTAGLAGIVFTGQVLTGVLGFAIILAATAEYWLGVTFRLTPQEASRRVGLSVSSIRWDDVVRVQANGVDFKLSPLPAGSKMDPFRGVLIRATNENREQVEQMIEARMKTNV